MLAEKIKRDVLEGEGRLSRHTHRVPANKQNFGDGTTVGLTVRRIAPHNSIVNPDARGVFLGASDGKYLVRLHERCMELMYDNMEALKADWELD